MNSAAIILCAGKGTRMNDDSKNKVCFDCAGIPVIKRIINNMRIGGVDKFVIVIGHQSESVMNCLDGESGIVYVCSTEQIDYLCDVLNDTDGVLGSEIVGAGLGGCVVALVKRESSDKVIETINKEYYDKYGYEHKADVYRASQSSSVIY